MNQDLLHYIGTWVDFGNEINNNIKPKLISKAQGTDYRPAFEKIYYFSYNNISRKELINNLQELKKAKVLLNNREEKNTLESFISDSEILFDSKDSEPYFDEIKSYIAKKVKKTTTNTSQNEKGNSSNNNNQKPKSQEEQQKSAEENRRREEQRKQQQEEQRKRQQEEQKRQNESGNSETDNSNDSEKERKKAERERKKREAEKAAEEARRYETQYQNEARKKQAQRNAARNKNATRKHNKKTINKFGKIVFTIAVLLFLCTEGKLVSLVKQGLSYSTTTEENINEKNDLTTTQPDNNTSTEKGKSKKTPTKSESEPTKKTSNDRELENSNNVEATSHESSEPSNFSNNPNNTTKEEVRQNENQPNPDIKQLNQILETLSKQFDVSNGKSPFETSAEYGVVENIIKIDNLIKKAESIDPNNHDVVVYRKKYKQIMSKYDLL